MFQLDFRLIKKFLPSLNGNGQKQKQE